MPDDAVIQGVRAAWAAGHWDEMADMIDQVGPKLIERVGVEPGMDVLDVGTGSGGNIAIPAALRGARAVGSDLVSDHFEDGRQRAAEAGVEIEWVQANAEELPFEDASFDRVFSTFGHMFAPRHELAAAELARVVRPGGIVATTTWALDSPISEMFRTMAQFAPGPPPADIQPPPLWGDEQHVRELLEPHGLEVEFERDVNVFRYDGTEDEYFEYSQDRLPPLAMAKAGLADRWDEVRETLIALFDKQNQGANPPVEIPSEYLITIARKPG